MLGVLMSGLIESRSIRATSMGRIYPLPTSLNILSWLKHLNTHFECIWPIKRWCTHNHSFCGDMSGIWTFPPVTGFPLPPLFCPLKDTLHPFSALHKKKKKKNLGAASAFFSIYLMPCCYLPLIAFSISYHSYKF